MLRLEAVYHCGGTVIPAAILFDLDGTLVDTERFWAEALSDFLDDRHCACPPEDILRIVLGRAWSDIYRSITTRFTQLAASTMPDMARDLRPYYLRLRQDRNITIPGSVTLLKRLADRYPVAVVSGSPRRDIQECLELIGTAPLIRFYLGSEDYPRGKPAPDSFLLAAEMMGVPPHACLVFEDSAAGVRSAKSAGMRCVALARPEAPPQDLSPADLVLADLTAFQPEDLPD